MLNAPVWAVQPAGDDAAQLDKHFQERFSGGRLSFIPRAGLSNFTLRVTGPDGYQGQVFSARVAPVFRLADHGSVPDGWYTYEISAAMRETRRIATGEDRPAQAGFIGVSQNGRFQIINGRIAPPDTDQTEG